MKRKFTYFVCVIMAFMIGFALMACSDGKSAYEIACDNGFVGTEQQWLDSLKGNDGKDSILDINDLFDIYLEKYPNSSFDDFLSSISVVGNSTEYAAAKGIQSAVSIFSTFTKRTYPLPGQPSDTDYSGAGSGVVYRIDGEYAYIITNYHVIYDRDSVTPDGIAKTINVYTYGNEYADHEVSCEFIGGSISKDIAVLKANVADFLSQIIASELGDSNELALGERVVAIGNPSAQGISVSVGVVSVDSEHIDMEALDAASGSVSMRVMRTDTPINKGNSGGGLFNAKGQLVGIVNAKTIESGVENIGYAIPVNVAIGIADCVIENDAKKCILGFSARAHNIQTFYDASKNRVEIKESIYVESVETDTLAWGNLQQNDKLVAVRINDGDTFVINRVFHLSDYLYNVRSGDIVHLDVERDGELVTISMEPMEDNFSPV